jgi:hypothetical protein
VPNNGGVELPLVDAPTFPKRVPELEPVFEFPAAPKGFFAAPPLEAGAPNEKGLDMALCCEGKESTGLPCSGKKDRTEVSQSMLM